MVIGEYVVLKRSSFWWSLGGSFLDEPPKMMQKLVNKSYHSIEVWLIKARGGWVVVAK